MDCCPGLAVHTAVCAGGSRPADICGQRVVVAGGGGGVLMGETSFGGQTVRDSTDYSRSGSFPWHRPKAQGGAGSPVASREPEKSQCLPEVMDPENRSTSSLRTAFDTPTKGSEVAGGSWALELKGRSPPPRSLSRFLKAALSPALLRAALARSVPSPSVLREQPAPWAVRPLFTIPSGPEKAH